MYNVFFCFCLFFFFQAEDGIRDLVRSRGLGDVYKRQVLQGLPLYPIRGTLPFRTEVSMNKSAMIRARVDPVSYTHLTLPTSDLV